ncbi:hypothetical protein ABK040_003658 [Willaertia magna]
MSKDNSTTYPGIDDSELMLEEENDDNTIAERKINIVNIDEGNDEQQEETTNQLDEINQEIERQQPTTHNNGLERSPLLKLWDLTMAMLPLGILSFGGPLAHISILEEFFVKKRNWISDEQFTELFAMCQSLPGPTSTQMVIAIGTIYFGNQFGGIFSFLLFDLPTAFVMAIAGIFLSDQNVMKGLPSWVNIMLNGFACACVSIVAQAAWMLSSKLAKSKLAKTLLILSASIFLVFPISWVIVVLMIVGGLISIVAGYLEEFIDKRMKRYGIDSMDESTWKGYVMKWISFFKTFTKNSRPPLQEDYNEETSQVEEEEKKKKNERITSTTSTTTLGRWNAILMSPLVGAFLLVIFFALLIGLFITKMFVKWDKLIWFEGFFRMGCLIFGGGHVVLPMILSEFAENEHKFITEDQFMNGLALQSALPGPMFNISAYVGGVMGSVLGAFICWLGLFLPAFLTIYAVLPFWKKYREKKIIQKILFGVNATAIGFVYVAVFMLFKTSVINYNIASTVTVLLTFGLLCVYDWSAPIVIIMGGLIRVALFYALENNK